MNTKSTLSMVALLLWCGMTLGGPLEPTNAPGPTGLPLTKLENRVALSAENTPGDADSRYRITLPGSYYLQENLLGPRFAYHGIEIAASNVTIDLNGFSVIGTVACLAGIRTDGVQDNIVIRNGTVRDWPDGGIDLTSGGSGRDCLIEGVVASGNGATGIRGNSGGIIRDCVAWENDGYGIWGPNNSVIVNCASRENGDGGFSLGSGSRMSGCTASQNTGRGVYALYTCQISDSSFFLNSTDGIYVFDGSEIIGCSSHQNSGNGLVGRNGCLITDCTATVNGLSGIMVISDSSIRGNFCDSNGILGEGAGIACTGGDNRIIRNSCSDNDWGIQATGSGNIVTQNLLTGNSVSMSLAAGNYGAVTTVSKTPALFDSTVGGVLPTSYYNMNMVY